MGYRSIGRTTDSGPVNRGSSPRSPARNLKRKVSWPSFFCCALRRMDLMMMMRRRRNLSRKASSPHQTHQRGSRPPSSRDFHKMGRRRERSPFRRELEKKRYGWWLSLSSLFPRTRLAGIPFERRTIPRSSALEKTANRDSIKSKVFGKGGMGLGEGRGNLSPERFPLPSPIFSLT